MINSAVVVHLQQKAKRKAKEEEYICVGGACSVCVSLTNFILGMPAMIEELPIDRSILRKNLGRDVIGPSCMHPKGHDVHSLLPRDTPGRDDPYARAHGIAATHRSSIQP